MKRVTICCAIVLGAALTAAAANRINFERTISARYPLPSGGDVAIVRVNGDGARVKAFVDAMLEQSNRSGLLRLRDAMDTETQQRIAKDRMRRAWRRAPPHPPDVALRVNQLACRSTVRNGEASVHDTDGNRVRRPVQWAEATCVTNVEAVRRSDARRLFSLDARGEGSSARVDRVTDEEFRAALDEAARYAGIAIADEITPRRVRESIELDETAPQFPEAMAMIESNELGRARRIWEAALPRHRDSAALHFDLAAVCEAMGDITGADVHFAAARTLAPADGRYRYEDRLFRRRNGLETVKSGNGRR